MRFVLFFLSASCFIIGIVGAVGAGAIWNNDIGDLQGVSAFLGVLIFIGMGARFVYRLGTGKGHRIFFPQQYWRQ